MLSELLFDQISPRVRRDMYSRLRVPPLVLGTPSCLSAHSVLDASVGKRRKGDARGTEDTKEER